ncbi:MAG TPA: TonB-dependent siderophore receptor [Methylotenera sp.]|nr:TonB-dependent siderophore receptor [Methylotenera sp.]
MQFIAATVQQSVLKNTKRKNQFEISKLTLAIRGVLLGTSVMLMASPTSALAETSTSNTIELKEVAVTAPATSDTQPVKGYNAKRSTTATKTDTELRDVPQAISVVTQDQIKDQSIQSVSEAVRYVPGVTAIQGEGNRDAIVFRGNATTGDFFVDGTRDDVQTYRDLYNTDRIEVLKGPSGMIFGRGGAGGVVNRVSKEAGWDPISQITASYGAYDQKRISADFGQAINDEIAFRINTVYENSGSYRDGVDLERYGVTPTVTIKPDEKSKIVLGMEYFKDKRVADRGVPSQATKSTTLSASNPDFDRRPYKIGNEDAFYGSAKLSPTETETVAFNAMFEHAFDNGVGVKNRTRYAHYNKYYQNVYADSPVAPNGDFTVRGYLDTTERENIINQTDLTYTAKWGSVEHKLLAGLELSTQDTSNDRLAGFFGPGAGSTQTTLNANNATEINNTSVSFRPNLTNNNNAFRDNQSTLDVIGLYLQDQIVLSPKWQAIVGLRHDTIKTDFDGSRRRGGSAANQNDLISESFNVTDNLLSPRAGLIFKPVEPVSLYANYSLSYVPRAGEQLTSLTATNKSFDPEKFINYEIGAKWDINPDLAFTAAIYKLERENVQVADPSNTAQSILLDGQVTKGIELGIAGNITDKWSIYGGIAFQDGEITKRQVNSTAANTIPKGAELGQTPDRTASIWNKYQINDIWAVALGVVSRSEMYALSPTVSQSTILPGYTRLDAAVFAKLNKNTRLQVNLENLTNKEYALYAHNNNNITPGSPITGRATLIYDF